MGYFDYLKGILEPLGIYDLESGAGADELEVQAIQLDEVFEILEIHAREMFLATAESYGLHNFGELLPYYPIYITNEDARQAIMALLRIRNGSFTLEHLRDTLRGCGVNAILEESDEPFTVIVSFPHNRGIIEGFDEIRLRIEEILPCHLAIRYVFIFTLWSEIMNKLRDWRTLEAYVPNWHELEIFQSQVCPEERMPEEGL